MNTTGIAGTNAASTPASTDGRSAGRCLQQARRMTSVALMCVAGVAAASRADAQFVVYESFRPIAAVPVAVAPAYGSYVANYTPSGNYAAVTAFSPPVLAPGMPGVAAPVAVTSGFAPAAGYATVLSSTPFTASYAPVTAYYAPAAVAPAVVAPVAAPVTAYYAPAAMQVYRRGLFGVYRPVPAAYVAPY